MTLFNPDSARELLSSNKFMRKNITTINATSTSPLARNFAAKLSGITALTFAAMATAHAHPGHALSDASTQHVLTSPYHLAVLALSGLALWTVGYFIHRRTARRVLQFGGAFAVATAAVLWGMGV
jgi:hypothetical protein